ncbi:MAG: DoxX family protein [Planctomycetota bacterium]|jgi:uncharacterized membrane protein YphA (DoxX/SURF4 family)
MSIALIARLILGVPLVVFGLNTFLHFMEPPGDLSPAAMAFLTALEDSGYLMQLKSGVEVVSGAMILSGIFLPFGLTIVAPVLVNIVAFHVFLDDPMMGIIGYVMTLCALYLAFAYRASFADVLSPLAKRSGAS